MRYHIRKEATKNGRKVEVQYAVVDNVDDHVVVRYEKESDAAALIARYEEAVLKGKEK